MYHVTSRGDRREPIFVDDRDRHDFLDVVAQALSRFDAQILAYCLMGNHYHFVLHTRRANLSLLMRHINGVYTQTFNRQHNKVGHLFQGRFKAILVDRDAYLLEVCRYVDLNPVRARMVKKPEAWAWSSYRAHVGLEDSPVWLDTNGLHGYCSGALRAAPPSAAARQIGMPGWRPRRTMYGCGTTRCASRSISEMRALSSACRKWLTQSAKLRARSRRCGAERLTAWRSG